MENAMPGIVFLNIGHLVFDIDSIFHFNDIQDVFLFLFLLKD
jgi:hypothetical protein